MSKPWEPLPLCAGERHRAKPKVVGPQGGCEKQFED